MFEGNNKKGFTLAEVLITLVVIGIIAAITIPVCVNQSKLKQYRTGYFKAKATLENAARLYHVQEGIVAECGYWSKNPYTNGGGCTAICVEYNEEGLCKRYECKENGGNLPSDYNGNFADCKKLYESFLKNLNVIKVCETKAYENGCIPKYKGNDTVAGLNNPDLSDYDINKSISGCSGFSREKILNGMAFVTGDGMIYFPYSGIYARLMAVDVNGQKGPNKWGHDIHALQPKMSGFESALIFDPGGCEAVEKGGISGAKLLYGKDYM